MDRGIRVYPAADNPKQELVRSIDMQDVLREFFARYEHLFNQALESDVDMDPVASLYASEFIAASPAGVRAGKNDDQLKQAMRQGYAYYRTIRTKEMRVRDVSISPMDDRHCVARVAWTAIYARPPSSDIVIDFDVHYLVQTLDGQPRIFGWVTGDEQAVLRARGVI